MTDSRRVSNQLSFKLRNRALETRESKVDPRARYSVFRS